jgi:hypothetical protein
MILWWIFLRAVLYKDVAIFKAFHLFDNCVPPVMFVCMVKVNVKVKVKVKVKLSLCFFLTEHHAMKAYWVSGSIAPRILDLGTRWR